MSDENDLLVEVSGPVMEIRLNRPKNRNAMTEAMIARMRHLLGEAEGDPAIRVLVIRGNGGLFCAGGDLNQIGEKSKSRKAGVAKAVRISKAFANMCLALSESDLPIITVVQGHAVGGGLGLACISDVCIADNTGRFGLAAMRIGATPAPIIPFVMERLGYSNTKMLAVTGNIINSGHALRIGLVHEYTTDIETTLGGYISSIVSCSPTASARTKAMARLSRFSDAPEIIEDACAVFGEVLSGEEGREGMAAFREKRKPDWVVD